MYLILKFKDGSASHLNIDNPTFSGQTELFELLQNVHNNPEGIIQIEDQVRKFSDLYSIEVVY